MKKVLWEVLVPTVSNEGKPFRTKHHRVWDQKVRRITGGLTLLKPVSGQWVAPCGTLFAERMIPVRVACTAKQIEEVADWVAKHYRQLAVFYFKVSDEVVIKHYGEEK